MNGIIKKIVLPIVLGLSFVLPVWGSYVIPDGSVSPAKLGVVADNSTIDKSGPGGTLEIKAGGVTQAKLATRPGPTPTVTAGGVAQSSSSGSYTTTSVTYATVTNLSVTLTTTGRPVLISMLPVSGSSAAFVRVSSSTVDFTGNIKILNNTSSISWITLVEFIGTTGGAGNLPCSSFYAIDFPASGTYNYVIQAAVNSGTGETLGVQNCILSAYEI